MVRRSPTARRCPSLCQVNNGDQLDGKIQYGRPFETWDKLSDGTWIYDWYMDTPLVATDGYSPLMPHCAADPSQRFVALGDSYSSGQGTYNYFGPNPDQLPSLLSDVLLRVRRPFHHAVVDRPERPGPAGLRWRYDLGAHGVCTTASRRS